jgi:hypothetical protein
LAFPCLHDHKLGLEARVLRLERLDFLRNIVADGPARD